MSYFNTVRVTVNTDNASGGAFARLRVANPETVFDSKQVWDNQPLFWDDQETSGSGTGSTWNANQASTSMTVSATTAGKRTRQTFQSFNYQPGKSQLVFMTGVLGGGGSGISARMGMGNDDNGIFLESIDGVVYLTIRTYTSGSAVNNRVAQADWNQDTLDGDGPSGITLDPTKSQILVFDFEWLGVGRVRAGIVVDGAVYYAHYFNHANVLDKVYMSTPNLPLRYEIENDGTGGAATLTHICSTVMSEGGSQDLGFTRSASTNGAAVTCSTENILYAIMGIRLKEAYIGSVVKLLSANIQLQTASETGEWRLLLNPTVAGSFDAAYADKANSAVQIALGATANTVTNGTEMGSGFGGSGGNKDGAQGYLDAGLKTSRYLGAAIDGSIEQIVLCWMPNGGTAAHAVEGSLVWREL